MAIIVEVTRPLPPIPGLTIGASLIASAVGLLRRDTARSYDEVLQETLERGIPGGRLRDGEPLLNNRLIDRRDVVRGGTPVVAPVPVPPTPVRPGPPLASGGLNQPTRPTTNEEPMSVFSDLINLGGQYVQARYGQPAPQVVAQPYPPLQRFADNPLIPNFIEGQFPGSSVAQCGTGCDGPRYLTYDCKEGTFKPRRRRRRKPFLTRTDENNLNFIASLPNTANVKTALAQLGGRR